MPFQPLPSKTPPASETTSESLSMEMSSGLSIQDGWDDADASNANDDNDDGDWGSLEVAAAPTSTTKKTASNDVSGQFGWLMVKILTEQLLNIWNYATLAYKS